MPVVPTVRTRAASGENISPLAALHERQSLLFAVSQLPRLPRTVLFYNGGAKLTVEGSESLEDLRNMEAQGVEILTCGTCLNFYGLAEKLAVGGVTNMYAIVEALANAGKVIKP